MNGSPLSRIRWPGPFAGLPGITLSDVPREAIKLNPGLGLLGVLLEPTTVAAKALEQVVFIGRCPNKK